MQLFNIQQSLIKAQAVQQFANRATEVARANQAAQVAFNEELARRADEVIIEANQLEHDGIRDDNESKEKYKRRERRRRYLGSSDEEEEAQDETKDDDASDAGPHRLDITA